MPISCHFQDCKALLVLSLSHVRSAIASAGLYCTVVLLKNYTYFYTCISVHLPVLLLASVIFFQCSDGFCHTLVTSDLAVSCSVLYAVYIVWFSVGFNLMFICRNRKKLEEKYKLSQQQNGRSEVLPALGCVHINTSTCPALYGFPYTSSCKHEFACISVAAIHIHASMGYL